VNKKMNLPFTLAM